MFVYVPPPPSAEAKELATKVAELVRILRSENPAIGPQDVRQALRLADHELRGELGLGGNQVALIVGVLAAMAAIGLFVAMSNRQPGTMIWVVAGMVVLLAVVALVVKGR